MLKFYVYAYLREDGTPYYVGKGQNGRAWSKHTNVERPPVNRIVIMEDHLTEFGAFALERRMIRWYGKQRDGGILENKTDGGYSSCGAVRSEETKKKMSEARAGRKFGPHSAERRAKIAEGNRKRKYSDETKAKLAQGTSNVPKVTCSHCSKQVAPWIFSRCHGPKCKVLTPSA